MRRNVDGVEQRKLPGQHRYICERTGQKDGGL